MKNISLIRSIQLVGFILISAFTQAQGFVINSVNPTQTPNLQCDSIVSISFSALTASVNSGADIDMVIQGANFQGTQFQVLINWGDGTNTIHYGGTSNSGTPIGFSPAIEHSYSTVGSQTIVVQVINMQNNSYAICTVPITIQPCMIYLYALVNIDCNNDGTNETNIPNGVPITLSNGTDQYSGTTVNNMINFSGIPLGTYTISIDTFWLNQNGYVVNSLMPNTITVSGPTTTYTTQAVLNCATPSNTNQCISGYLFCDANSNGIFDSGELAVANAPVHIQTNTGNTITVYTDPNGFYSTTYTAPPQTPAIVTVNPNWLVQNGYTVQQYIFTTITTDCSMTNALVNFPVGCATSNPPQGCVSGFVWCDANGDGDFDTNEIPLIGAPVMLQGSLNNVTVYSDSTGFYSYCGTLLNQTYTIGSINPNWLASHGYTISNNYYTMVFTSGLNTQPVGFGVNCGGTPNACADLWTTVTPWIGYFQNQTNYIHLNFGNYGPGAPGNYTVSLAFPAGVTPVTSSISIPGYTIFGNTISWTLTSSQSSFSFSDIIAFNVPSGINSGTVHMFMSGISIPGSADCNPYNNTAYLCQLVGNSYDPNDKSVDVPEGIETIINDRLTYTIRFQNTGTAPAQDVYIIDTLSANLDLSTISVVAASHTMHMVDLGNGVIRFDFPQIWLPDSTSNEPLSHGHVVFQITENAGNLHGSEIFNTGYIYFDWNPAIVTNTTYNVNGELGIDENETDIISVYPNPVNDQLTINSASNIHTIQIINLSGQLIKTINVNTVNATIDTQTLNSGMYLINVETENGLFVEKILKK